MVQPSSTRIRVAQIVPATSAEGPGRRFALWFQGCPLRCPGCCNPEMLPFDGGKWMDVAQVVGQMVEAHRQHGIEGVTMLGGEPTAQAVAAAAIASEARRLGLSVMLFSGHTLEELRQMADPAIEALLTHTDLLVDGAYLRERPETRRRWIGSANQRAHCLTDRYHEDDPCWRQTNTVEIRLRSGEITVNGFPTRPTQAFLRDLARRKAVAIE
jgi:anaerobic ribonucleoside-triphosphate reductase activating protein